MKYRGFVIIYHQDLDLYGIYRSATRCNPSCDALVLLSSADRAKAYIDKEVSNA